MKPTKIICSLFFLAASLTFISSFGAAAAYAQETTTKAELKQFCDDIFTGEAPKLDQSKWKYQFKYNYEYRIWKLAGADPLVDTEETAIPKIQKWYDKYKLQLVCDVDGFSVSNGSLLKYSIYKDFTHLIESFVLVYDLDINVIDISDGKTVLDYIDDEIKRIDPNGKYSDAVKSLKSRRATLVSWGAKTSAEIEQEKRKSGGKP